VGDGLKLAREWLMSSDMVTNFMWFVPLFAGGIVIWITAHMLAPIGYQVSFGRVVGATFVMRGLELLVDAVLHPQIGDWSILAHFVAAVLVIKIMLWLNVWRSVAITVIYFFAFFALYFGIGLYAHYRH
jgi:hypothetical protein